MKISASIYSDKTRPLSEIVLDLHAHQIDLLHIDCNDDLSVFNDIKQIRQLCNIPIDLHIITENPEKFYPLLIENPVEYLTFQYENLKSKLNIPSEISGKKGIAIITPTSIDIFEQYKDFDFILIMATIPGQSGGVFDKINFTKIRQFRNKYPSKSIHVDGGVNGEVSFILRNMGVSSSVSGSYLFNAASVGHALMNLTKRDVASQFKIEDFMTPINECPTVQLNSLSLKNILLSIENGNLGFCLVLDNNTLLGLISNADIRKSMIRHLDDLNQINTTDIINKNPIKINQEASVLDLLHLIKKCTFPVMYLPVIKNNGDAAGIINFTNLIKGEI